MKVPTYIIYKNDHEIIACTPAREGEIVQTYFREGDRMLDDYDRIECFEPAVVVSPRLQLD